MESTECIICKDDYGEIADECLSFGVCEDCRDSYSSEELIDLIED